MDTENSKWSILIVEQNKKAAELIKVELRKLGITSVVHVVNKKDNEQYFIPGKFDAILCDYLLGENLGIKILEEVRLLDASIPFIFVSESVGEERAVEVLKKGATDYVLKEKLEKLPFVLTRAINEAKVKKAEAVAAKDAAFREGHFKMLVENAAGLITIIDENGKFIYCSPNVERILGYNEEEFLKKNCLDLIPFEHHNSVKETWKTVFNSPESQFTFIHKFLSITNEFRIIESAARSTIDSAGRNILILNSNDITEKFENEKLRRTSEEILKRVNSIVIMVNADNEISYVSPSVKKVLGYEPEELFGKEYWIKTSISGLEAEQREKSVKKLLQNGVGEKDQYDERALRTKEGGIKWIAWEKSKATDGSIIGVGQDITEIRKLEREKNEMQQKVFSMLEDLVSQRTEEVVRQRKIIEQKNKDFTDSIQYAKRLQDAIHPTIDHISSVFSENFIIYKPKDIVAGDFFWAHENKNYFMIAVADCTGHGVPGAMVSVVCSNALEKAVNEYNLVDPGKILDKATEIVLETFFRKESLNDKSHQTINDGMDISLLVINMETKEIFWAGANSPLYYIQDNRLNKLRADKQPIGSFVRHFPFTTQQVKNIPGTIFYLLTDGFADQFGGPHEKKFMKKRLVELFFSTRNLSLSAQKEILRKTFLDWKGEFEQVDDVTIIGLRLDDKFNK